MSNKQPERLKKQSQIREIWRRLRKSKTAMFGLIVLSLLILTAVFAEQIVPYEKALAMDPMNRMAPASFEHPFGTDAYGRDMMARVLHGARRSLAIGFLATFGGLAVGWLIASLATYYGGMVDLQSCYVGKKQRI